MNIKAMEYVRLLGPPRPRLDTLLEEALQYPVVAVMAGQGYAKRQLVADFLKRRGAAVVWMHISKLDNLTSRFWNSLLAAFSQSGIELELPAGLRAFPDTPELVEAFIQAIAELTRQQENLVLVIEAHDHIQNETIQQLLHALALCQPPNFSLWLLGIVSPRLNLVTLLDSGCLYQITSGDLCFTAAEIARLLLHHGIPHGESDLRAFYQQTEGWPLAVAQMLRHCSAASPAGATGALRFPHPRVLFGQEYFLAWPAAYQQLLVKLSCLPLFTEEIVALLGGLPTAEAMDLLQDHPFIELDPMQATYTFHGMYRTFLAEQQAKLPAEVLVQVYTLAGSWFLENGWHAHAIPCLEKCGRYDDMYQAILGLPLLRPKKELADFVLEHLGRLPEAYIRANPVARCTYASLLISNLEVDAAEDILMQLRAEYEQKPQTPNVQTFLGELYLMLSDVSLLRNSEDFAWYYVRAAECLPHRSRLRDEKLMLAANNSVFFLPDTRPGTRARMEGLVSRAMPVGAAVMRGCGWGMEHLFMAESAYLTTDMQRAWAEAHRAIYKAQERSQHDIVCNAYFLLMRINMDRGQYKDAYNCLCQAVGYIEDNNLTALFGLRDCIKGWFYLQLDDEDNLPGWITADTPTLLQTAPISQGRPRLLRASYLLRKLRREELLALLLEMEGHYKQRGLWVALLDTRIMQAVCHLKNEDTAMAMKALWAAYDMAYANDILMPFVEQGSSMRALVDAARKQTQWAFDEAWLDTVQQKANTYAKRHGTLKAAHRRENADAGQNGPGLSRRELEVLQNLAQGLTRDEIGRQMHISVNTVKSMIKNIYNKLNAVNRADAVHIANMLGLIA